MCKSLISTLLLALAISSHAQMFSVDSDSAAAPAAAPPAAPPAAAPAATPGAPASILYKTPKEGERIPRSKGIYVEYHIENFVEGMWSKFFLRSAEIARPTTDRFGFEFPEAGPGFYTVRVELYDENGRLLQSKPRRFMVY